MRLEKKFTKRRVRLGEYVCDGVDKFKYLGIIAVGKKLKKSERKDNSKK